MLPIGSSSRRLLNQSTHSGRDVPVLARMAAKRAAGYSAIGYTIVQGRGLFDG